MQIVTKVDTLSSLNVQETQINCGRVVFVSKLRENWTVGEEEEKAGQKNRSAAQQQRRQRRSLGTQ